MEAITKWFEKKDYDTGLALLSKHSKNNILLQNLSRKQNPAKLEYELKKVLDRNGVSLKTKPPKKPIKKQATKPTRDVAKANKVVQQLEVITPKKIKLEDLPEELQKVYKETTNKYKVMRGVHERLKIMENADTADRAPLMEKLLKLDTEIRQGWKLLDTFARTGVIPKELKKSEKKPIDHKRINANRKYISKNKSKLTGDKADVWLEKIQERVTELVEAGETFKQQVIDELKPKGIKF